MARREGGARATGKLSGHSLSRKQITITLDHSVSDAYQQADMRGGQRVEVVLVKESAELATGLTRVLSDGTGWPMAGEALDKLEWELRYGEHPNFSAASVVAAYRALLQATRSRCAQVVRMMREQAACQIETDRRHRK